MERWYVICYEYSFPWSGLSIGNRGSLFQKFSIKTTEVYSVKRRECILSRCFRAKRGKEVFGFFLNSEDLAPGGSDLFEGILLLRFMEKSGVDFVVIESGVGEFWSLKYRDVQECLSGFMYITKRVRVPILVRYNGCLSRKIEQVVFEQGGGGILY
ncbi:MAG: hypothetical protein HYS16_00010 [Deltaproteobacteria bacterium]|nr:MAG: hypothetical protein HYS16_00010 [Deltaproteobacteria bacterium]